jgi:uncharacterized protein (DUF1697 family)
VSDGPTHAAFLRGVHLGAKRKVSGDQLRSILGDLGLDHADSFRTSGNAVFATGREPRDKLTRRVERGLEKELGYDVTVFLRTAAEVRAIAAHDPFPGETGGKLQVMMLTAKPKAAVSKGVLELAAEREERMAFEAKELYWLPEGGVRDAAPFLRAVDKLLVDPTTTRTMQTMEKLAEKYF